MTAILRRRNLDTDMCAHRGNMMGRDRGKMAIYKPRREASEEPTLMTPGSWTSSLQNCEKINFCC